MSPQRADTVALLPSIVSVSEANDTVSARQVGQRVWPPPLQPESKCPWQTQTHWLRGWWGYISGGHAADRMRRPNKERQRARGLRDDDLISLCAALSFWASSYFSHKIKPPGSLVPLQSLLFPEDWRHWDKSFIPSWSLLGCRVSHVGKLRSKVVWLSQFRAGNKMISYYRQYCWSANTKAI